METLAEAEQKAEEKEEKDAEISEPNKGKETMEVEIQNLLEGRLISEIGISLKSGGALHLFDMALFIQENQKCSSMGRSCLCLAGTSKKLRTSLKKKRVCLPDDSVLTAESACSR